MIQQELHFNQMGPVEKILKESDLEYELTSLPKSVIGHADLLIFQTRDTGVGPNATKLGSNRVNGMVHDLKLGRTMPAVVLFYVEEKYYVCDGRHRMEAYVKADVDSFAAYVITNCDRTRMMYIGPRLSCVLNDINGERAGNDEKEKSDRKISVMNCAAQIVEVANSTGRDYKDFIKDLINEYGLQPAREQVDQEVCGKLLRIEITKIPDNAKLLKLIDASILTKSELPLTYKWIRRCETNLKKIFLQTIGECKNQGLTGEKNIGLLREYSDKPVSDYLDAVRKTVDLNADNKKMNPQEMQRQQFRDDYRKAFARFRDSLPSKKGIKLYGDDRHQFLVDLRKVKELVLSEVNGLEDSE